MSDPRAVVVAVVGATGVGKSDAAVALAHRINGEIINADSMQVYRGMDIGTAKLTTAQRHGIPHHVIDVWDVDQEANVAAFQELARDAIARVHDVGRIPILVGGSGLYVNAVIDDLRFPGHDPQVRRRLEQELAEVGSQALHERLRAVDPEAAAGVLPSNGRRVVRALEVWHITGAAPRTRLPQPEAIYPTVLIGLTLPTDQLNQRLEQRVHDMWQQGFVGEVSALAARLQNAPTARFALGYRQILEYLEGECTEAEAFTATVRATRKFARRQSSWFGRDERIQWLTADSPDMSATLTSTVEQGISRLLNDLPTPRLYP